MSNYKPKEFAEMIGVSVKTLQRWDREGILKAYRNPKDRRYYTDKQYAEYTGKKGIIVDEILEDIGSEPNYNRKEWSQLMGIKFTVYGKPQGKARPRFTRQGRAYTPKNTVDYEKQIKQAYIAAGGTLMSDTDPILICITACFKKAKTNKMPTPTLKPDTDNIAKAVCDALNGVAYKDDKQITCLTVDKVWADDGIEKVVVELNLKLIF